MSTIAVWASKAWLILTMIVTGITSALPGNVIQLAAPSSTATAAAPSHPRLERAWAREQRVYDRLGRCFENVDRRIQRGQQLIDKAKANGKDVTALQAALDAFDAAVKQAHPTYEGLNGIVSSHQGFDANGAVIDPVKAYQTVLDMRDKLQAIRTTVIPAAKALRQAVRDFRLANPAVSTPTP
jgi:hypothetical protein